MAADLTKIQNKTGAIGPAQNKMLNYIQAMWCHCWGRGAAQRRYFYQTYHHLQWVVPETGPYQPCFYEKSLFICALFNSTDAMPCCQIIFFLHFSHSFVLLKIVWPWLFFVDLLLQTFCIFSVHRF